MIAYLAKILRNIVVFILVFGFLFSNLPFDIASRILSERNMVDKMWQASNDGNVVDLFAPWEQHLARFRTPMAYAAVGDARIQYGTGTNATPQTRFYTSLTNSWGAANPTVAGTANVGWVISKESPTEDVTIVVTQSSTGKLDIFCRTGSTWTKDIANVTIGTTAATRRFDVEFEKTSGVPMVLYSTNTATTNELSYYRKTSAGCGAGSWTGPTTLNPTVITGIVLWVELEARQTSGSNVLAAAFSDANATAGGKLEAMIWNGSWGNESPAGAAQGWSDLSIELQGTAGANAAKVFDLAFETNTGDLFIAWGTSTGANGTNGWRYATCSATLPCTWSGVLTPAGPLDDATNVACAPDPGSNAIACIAEGNAGADMSAWLWSGTAVGATTGTSADATALATAAGDMHVDIDWVVSGSQRMAVGLYAETTTGLRYIYYDTVGAAWRTNTTTSFTPTGAPATAVQSIKAQTNPNDKTQLLVNWTDANSDLWSERLVYNGGAGGATTALSTWALGNAGVALELSVSSITSMPFWLDWVKVAPPNTLTIGVTAGSMMATTTSGDTSVYANNTSCASAATCAAFTLNVSNTSVTVSSIGITETGTVNATSDLSQLALFYDTDGNYSNGVTGQYGAAVASFTGETATTTGSLALTPATTYYFYVRFNASSTTTYPAGGQTIDFQIATNSSVTLSSGSATITGAPANLAGAMTVKPRMTGVTYGSGLSDGARSSELITISGYGFGVAPSGSSRDNCAGAVNTGCVRFVVGGNATIANTDISAWSNTAVTSTINVALASYGGVSALELVSGSVTSTNNFTYYIHPNITAIAATSTNAAREYDASDVDGLVMLSGDHFGSTQGTVSFTGAFGGGGATIHSTAEGSCTTGGWSAAGYSGNTVCIEVTPASIPDSIYSGTITLTRNSDSKTHTANPTFYIMPRIISNTPANGIVTDRIKIAGNHFCQSGTCPVAYNRSTISNNVKFGSTQAIDTDAANTDFVNSGVSPCSGNAEAWTNTEICVEVPAGTPVGSQLTKLRTNNTYDSNTKAFTINSTVPNNPTDLNQFKENGLTVIPAGGTTISSTVILKATSTASMSINMILQVEVEPTGTAFDGIGIIDGPVCTGCTSTSTAVTVTELSEGTKHWRGRTKNTSTSETSNWVYYGTSDINEIDFKIDATAPTITFTPTDTCVGGQSNPTSNSITINWSLNEQANGQVEYSTASDLSGSTNYPAPPSATSTSHSITLINLNSNTTYYYKVKSQDNAGNLATRPTSQPYCNFITYTITTEPVKTTTFFVIGATSTISGGATATTSFPIYMIENATSVKSAFVEIYGISPTSGTNNIQIQVNSQAVKTYVINSNETSFRIYYKVDAANLNIDPTNNIFYITPSISTNIASAKIIVSYSYSP